jgi:radical SAM superfamily enzyme
MASESSGFFLKLQYPQSFLQISVNGMKTFLEYLNPNIIVERLFSRVPEKDAVFSNWNTSWWKLQDELLTEMQKQNTHQGEDYHYLNGGALDKL